MKILRLILLATALVLTFGCRENENNDGTGQLMILRWDNLPAQLDLSDASRIEVTTAAGTQQRNIGCGRIFYLSDAHAPIETVRVHFAESGVALPVDGSHVSVSGHVLSITLDMSDVSLVYDRSTLDAVRDNLSGNYLQIADIDLSDGDWTPIGSSYNDAFTGTYDGGGFAIRGMTVVVTGSGFVYAGLFGYNKGGLRNIHLEGGLVSGTYTGFDEVCFGGVCGLNSGTITACTNSVKVSGTSTDGGSTSCGGVCGLNSGTITACTNSVNVSGTANLTAYCGGVCGWNEVGSTITACTNSGNVSGTYLGPASGLYGGVCGWNRGTITACTNSGNVSGASTHSSTYCGGVCGENNDGTITSCTNSGDVSGEAGYASCGGVCGYNSSFGTITACTNSGNVSAETVERACCGGLCGTNNQGTITACTNSGSVSGTSTSGTVYCGGVCGNNGSTITACTNSANVSGTSTSGTVNCGGVCGRNESGTITACTNSANVSGTSTSGTVYCGGVCGLNYQGTITYCYWGGGSASLNNAVGTGSAADATTKKFGDGTNDTGWPTSDLAGWGDTAPGGWNATSLGPWANPWASLGAWNGGNPSFPTLKSPTE